MMSRWIDADVLTKEIKQDIADDGLTERYVFYRINEASSVNLVWCKECKYCMYDADGDMYRCLKEHIEHTLYDANKHFCSYGERRTND